MDDSIQGMRVLWLVVTTAACGYPALPTISSDGGAMSGEAAMPDAAVLCFGSFAPICFDDAASLPKTIKTVADNIDIDTDSLDSAICDQHHTKKADYCVFAGAGFTWSSGKKLTAHGSKPLIVLSTKTIEINGDIDVSSNHSGA